MQLRSVSRSRHSPKQRLCRRSCTVCWPTQTHQQLAREPDLAEPMAESNVPLCPDCFGELIGWCECGELLRDDDDDCGDDDVSKTMTHRLRSVSAPHAI